jgi:hypothetical protein
MNNQTLNTKKTVHPESIRHSILFYAVRLIYEMAYKGISGTTVREIIAMCNFSNNLYKHLIDAGILSIGFDGLYYKGHQEPSKENILNAYKTSSNQVKSSFLKSIKELDIQENENALPEISFEETDQSNAENFELTGQQDSYQEFLEYRQFLAWKKSQNN